LLISQKKTADYRRGYSLICVNLRINLRYLREPFCLEAAKSIGLRAVKKQAGLSFIFFLLSFIFLVDFAEKNRRLSQRIFAYLRKSAYQSVLSARALLS